MLDWGKFCLWLSYISEFCFYLGDLIVIFECCNEALDYLYINAESGCIGNLLFKENQIRFGGFSGNCNCTRMCTKYLVI